MIVGLRVKKKKDEELLNSLCHAIWSLTRIFTLVRKNAFHASGHVRRNRRTQMRSTIDLNSYTTRRRKTDSSIGTMLRNN